MLNTITGVIIDSIQAKTSANYHLNEPSFKGSQFNRPMVDIIILINMLVKTGSP